MEPKVNSSPTVEALESLLGEVRGAHEYLSVLESSLYPVLSPRTTTSAEEARKEGKTVLLEQIEEVRASVRALKTRMTVLLDNLVV